MATAALAHGTPLAGTHFLPTACALGLVAFAGWLTLDQEVAARVAPHDELFFLQRAACAYWFDQGYTHMTFIKEPVYPLFAWVCFRLHVPLRLATEAVYLAAAALFSWSLVRRRANPWVGLLVFAACVLHPMRFAVFGQTTADALYPSLLLLTLAALFVQIQDEGLPGGWRRGLCSGLALGLLWNTRAERPLAALLLLCFLAWGATLAWRRGPTWKRALRHWLSQWSLPVLVLTLMALTILTANYYRFGAFAYCDLVAPGHWSAYQALVSIQPERPLRCVPVTREALRRAYEVSPSCRQLQPFLDGKVGQEYAGYSRVIAGLEPGEIAGGWFCWALRDAADAAGHCSNPTDSEAFYRRIAQEIHEAAAEGRLTTRKVLPFGLDPNAGNYLPYLPASAAKILARCYSTEQPPPLADHDAEVRTFFDAVAHRRPVPASPTAQTHVRHVLWSVYGPVMSVVLLAGGLLCGAVLLWRPNAPGRGWYFFTLGIVAVAAFSRIGLFALIDASAFPGDSFRYLFPAALLLSVLATWLAAEGTRLLHPGTPINRRTANLPVPRS